MKTLIVWFNWDGYIKVIEEHILEAFAELQIEYKLCYWEDFPQMVDSYQPVFTLFFHPNRNIYNLIEAIKQAKCHKLLWDMESPYESDIIFDMVHHIHYMFVSDKNTVKELQNVAPGNKIFYVPHACNPNIHKPIPYEDIPYEYKSDVVFVGNAYKSRIAWFNENRNMFKDKMLTVVGVGWWGMDGYNNHRFIRRHVTKQECNLYYNGAKMVLNLHRQNEDLDMANKRGITPHHLNNRFYEVAAIGKPQTVIGRDFMKKEIDLISSMHPSEYSYTARLKEYFLPLLT